MLKTKDKQSKNDNTINSFLVIKGESTKAVLVQENILQGRRNQRKTKVNRKSKQKE